MTKIQEALDLTEQLLDGTEHLENVLEILGIGFLNSCNSDRQCEVSCLFIIGKYIELVQQQQLEKLCDLWEEMR